VDTKEEIMRLLALQLRRATESQAMTIREMAKVGFTPKRIAELLGTTPNTVSQELADAKKQAQRDGRHGKANSNAS
jgi:predicted transcriptional regulator